jgi:hypothetical protein
VSENDGTLHDQFAYPLTAFRELIANALVHRDLDNWSAGRAVEVRLRRDRLVIANPGGLYGITVDRPGRESVTSARNSRLVAICQYVHSPESGLRVIEALAAGIPRDGGTEAKWTPAGPTGREFESSHLPALCLAGAVPVQLPCSAGCGQLQGRLAVPSGSRPDT